MKLGLSLSGVNESISNLQDMGVIITADFTSQLIQYGKQIRDRAKEILEGKTNPQYSTGKLRNSIEMKTTGQTGTVNGVTALSISVGPDMRVAPYAEWVEFGHYMVGGWVAKGQKVKGARWWPGHHYMEGAWLEISPNITKQIGDTLSVKLNDYARTAKRTQHKYTGQFVAGFGGID